VSPEPATREIFLNPGDFAFGDGETRIRTILGSCVAVTFWHPGLRIGAMCHYLLPARAAALAEPPGGKYAGEVIPIISRHFADLGLQADAFQVKMFGGSSMFPGLSLGESLNIGAKNIHMGLAVLTRSGFKIHNYDLAGGTNRTVVFDIGSGEVWVRQGQGPPLAPCPDSGRRGPT
jgi:chemotaxis protein CheD